MASFICHKFSLKPNYSERFYNLSQTICILSDTKYISSDERNISTVFLFFQSCDSLVTHYLAWLAIERIERFAILLVLYV